VSRFTLLRYIFHRTGIGPEGRLNKFNFTKKKIEEILPVEKRQYFFDEKQKGLRLAVTSAGSKTYQFQAWSPAKQKPVSKTLGKVGDISVSEARRRAAELLSEVSLGGDPEEVQKAKRAEQSLSEVFDQYIAIHGKGKKRSWQENERTFKNCIKKLLGGLKVSEITSTRIKSWHAKIGRDRGHYSANRALALLSVVYSKTLEGVANPCTTTDKFKETSRERYLQPEELKGFFEGLAVEKQIFQDFFNLLLLTGARKNNVLSMRWDEISGGVWTIPAKKAKSGKAIRVPLMEKALEILETRENDSGFVFPGRGKSGHLADPKGAWERILDRAEIKDLRIHDLRRTVGSYQAATGANVAVISKTLGHSSAKTTAIYTHLDLDPVRDSLTTATNKIFGDSDEE